MVGVSCLLVCCWVAMIGLMIGLLLFVSRGVCIWLRFCVLGWCFSRFFLVWGWLLGAIGVACGFTRWAKVDAVLLVV